MYERQTLKLPHETPEIWNKSGDKQRKLEKSEKQKAMEKEQ